MCRGSGRLHSSDFLKHFCFELAKKPRNQLNLPFFLNSKFNIHSIFPSSRYLFGNPCNQYCSLDLSKKFVSFLELIPNCLTKVMGPHCDERASVQRVYQLGCNSCSKFANNLPTRKLSPYVQIRYLRVLQISFDCFFRILM